jgi:hypothetical protein
MIENVMIIGAGPYALALSAHLRACGVEPKLHGEVMGFWKTMPETMFLRSYYRASSIGDPQGRLTLDDYERARGHGVPRPIPLADFIDYGEWFATTAGIQPDCRFVTHVTRKQNEFEVTVETGETITARRIVVAAGITPFAWKPRLFERIPHTLASHTSDHRQFDDFEGKRVIVVGAGQGALETTACLIEAGAETELLVRRPDLRFLRGERLYDTAGFVSRVAYPSWGVGPPGVNWVMGRPSLYRWLPRLASDPMARRAIRPAGAAWLRPRLESARVTTGRAIVTAESENSHLRLRLDDGSIRLVDHAILGSGYRIDIRRYDFLDSHLVADIRLVGSYPRLSSAFESSVPGLYFVGAPAAASAGPGLRFVSHTGLVASTVSRHIFGRN